MRGTLHTTKYNTAKRDLACYQIQQCKRGNQHTTKYHIYLNYTAPSASANTKGTEKSFIRLTVMGDELILF